MNERDEILRSVGQSQRAIDRMDATLARRVVAGYEAARKALVAELVAAYERLGSDPSPAQIRGLLSQRSLIASIERRIDVLMRELNEELQQTVRGVTSRAFMAVSAEIEIMALALGVDAFVGLGVDALLELTIGPAIEQIAGLSAATKVQMTSALRSQLAQGARLDEITRVLFGKGVDVGFWQRGMNSARKMAHRAVSEAENTARTAYLEQAAGQIDGLMKQAVAKVDSKTSETCLRVHGEIVAIDKPFELTGKGRLARKKQVPPFHWGPCRTTVTGYHKRFEESSGLKTADMKREAAEALAA